MSIYKKLLDVKKKIPYLQKDKKSYQFSYAAPSKVLGTINPLLNDAGILLKVEVVNVEKELVNTGFQFNKTIKDNIEKQEFLFTVTTRMTFIDVETGEKDENMFFGSGLNGYDKGFGSALTYNERYFLLKYFQIPTDEDDPDSFQEKQLTPDEVNRLKEEKKQEQIKKDKNKKIEQVIDAKASLILCESIESLGEIYMSLDGWLKTETESLKDELKEKLNK